MKKLDSIILIYKSYSDILLGLMSFDIPMADVLAKAEEFNDSINLLSSQLSPDELEQFSLYKGTGFLL